MVDTSDSSFLSDLLLYRLIGAASLFDLTVDSFKATSEKN